MSQLFKALVFFDDGQSPPAIVQAIEYQGQLWLVSGWIELPAKAVSKPVRLIPLDPLLHQRVSDPGFDIVVNAGLPRQLFDPEVPTELRNRFQILEGPDIEIPAGGGRVQ